MKGAKRASRYYPAGSEGCLARRHAMRLNAHFAYAHQNVQDRLPTMLRSAPK